MGLTKHNNEKQRNFCARWYLRLFVYKEHIESFFRREVNKPNFYIIGLLHKIEHGVSYLVLSDPPNHAGFYGWNMGIGGETEEKWACESNLKAI